MDRPKYAHTSSDVPSGDHFAIVFFRTISIPPQGHGYPESTEQACDYVVYPNKEAWETEIARLATETGYGRSNYTPIFARRAKVTTKVEVNVS